MHRHHQTQQLGSVATKIALTDESSSTHIPRVRVHPLVSLLLDLDVRVHEANGTGAAMAAYAYHDSPGYMYS
jgi:hypothetical protein